MSEGRRKFDWRAHLKVHPAADLFPLLPPDELQALADDIKKNGLQAPIVLWTQWSTDAPVLADGRNRLDALALLGWLSPPRDRFPREAVKKYQRYINNNPIEISEEAACGFDWFPFQQSDTEDAYALVLSLNIHRRHLTAEQKRELIAKVLKAKPEASNNSIAKEVKADDKTVASVRRDLESTSEIPKLEKTVGADGKLRKAKPATKVPQAWREKAAAQGRDIAVGPARALYMVPAKDTALESFDAVAFELIRLTKNQEPQRFAKTAVPLPLLGDLAHYLRELVAVRKLTAADDAAGEVTP